MLCVCVRVCVYVIILAQRYAYAVIDKERAKIERALTPSPCVCEWYTCIPFAQCGTHVLSSSVFQRIPVVGKIVLRAACAHLHGLHDQQFAIRIRCSPLCSSNCRRFRPIRLFHTVLNQFITCLQNGYVRARARV